MLQSVTQPHQQLLLETQGLYTHAQGSPLTRTQDRTGLHQGLVGEAQPILTAILGRVWPRPRFRGGQRGLEPRARGGRAEGCCCPRPEGGQPRTALAEVLLC